MHHYIIAVLDTYTTIYHLADLIRIANLLKKSDNLFHFAITLRYIGLIEDDLKAVVKVSQKLDILNNISQLLTKFSRMKSWNNINKEFVDEIKDYMEKLLKQ